VSAGTMLTVSLVDVRTVAGCHSPTPTPATAVELDAPGTLHPPTPHPPLPEADAAVKPLLCLVESEPACVCRSACKSNSGAHADAQLQCTSQSTPPDRRLACHNPPCAWTHVHTRIHTRIHTHTHVHTHAQGPGSSWREKGEAREKHPPHVQRTCVRTVAAPFEALSKHPSTFEAPPIFHIKVLQKRDFRTYTTPKRFLGRWRRFQSRFQWS
jgi:hypothetical protein